MNTNKSKKNSTAKFNKSNTVKENVKETSDNAKESFSNLKKETDEIKKLTTKNYSKRTIVSNWEKYKQIESDDDDSTVAADFSTLLLAPTAEGGYFQFKNEKDWNSKIETKYSEYFSLDLKNLTNAILSIPFYERAGINSSLLTGHQKSDMNTRAMQYQNKLKKGNSKSSQPSKSVKNDNNKIETSTVEKINDTIIQILQNDSDQNNFTDKKDINNKVNDDNIIHDQVANVETESSNDLKLEKCDEKFLNLDVDELLELDSSTLKCEGTLMKTVEQLDLTTENLSANEIASHLQQTATPSALQEDLEQWLDNILDD